MKRLKGVLIEGSIFLLVYLFLFGVVFDDISWQTFIPGVFSMVICSLWITRRGEVKKNS
jgi:hypothetical protein